MYTIFEEILYEHFYNMHQNSYFIHFKQDKETI